MLHNSKAGTAEAKDRPAISVALWDSGSEKEEQLRRRFLFKSAQASEFMAAWRQPLAPHTKCLLIKTRPSTGLLIEASHSSPLVRFSAMLRCFDEQAVTSEQWGNSGQVFFFLSLRRSCQ